MKRSKTSRTSPSAMRISARTASSTIEVKTSGRSPDSRCASFTCATASCAFSIASMNGIVTRTKSTSANCVRSEEPRPSTVMPVRSETKKTRLRWDMVWPGGNGLGDDAPQHCHIPLAIIARSDGPLPGPLPRQDFPPWRPATSCPSDAPHDRRGHGRRQERFPRGAHQPAGGERRARAGRLRHDGPGLPRFPRPQPARGAHREGARRRGRGRRRARSPRRAPRSASSIEEAASCRPSSSARSATNTRGVARDAPGASFAVRSSATAEDLPDASFAGQQETYLNIQRRRATCSRP